MSHAKVKLGRPTKEEDRSTMTSITFKADPETLAALERLEAEVGANVRGRRSVLIRKLILRADQNSDKTE